MHSLRLLGLCLSLLLLSPMVQAAGKKKQLARFLASTKLEFRLDSPEVQRVEDAEATVAFEAFTAGPFDKVEQKNLEEYRLQLNALTKRGFEARTKPLSGRVFGSAKSFVVYRKDTQELPAMNGEEAYTSLQFDFHYEQSFLEKGVAPMPGSLLPFLELRGYIFVRCKAKGQDCAGDVVGIRDVGIRWGHLPSARGANSSAGGAGQN
jgi:hypothetical protein